MLAILGHYHKFKLIVDKDRKWREFISSIPYKSRSDKHKIYQGVFNVVALSIGFSSIRIQKLA